MPQGRRRHKKESAGFKPWQSDTLDVLTLTSPELARRDAWKVYRRSPCVYCGGVADTLDHVVPLAECGGDELGNLVPSCEVCNKAKGASSLLIFLSDRPDRARRFVAHARHADEALQVVAREIALLAAPRRKPAITPISTERLGPILVSDVADAPALPVVALWGDAMSRSFGARSRRRKSAPDGAFGSAPRHRAQPRETADEATRRGYAAERQSYVEWRDSEDEEDVDVEYCPECAGELRFMTTLSGTLGWECATCRDSAFERAFDGVAVIHRGRSSGSPFVGRMRHFDYGSKANITVQPYVQAPWWEGGTSGRGFDARWIPKGYERANNLTLALLKYLATLSKDRLPQDEDAARDVVVWLRWPNGPLCAHCGVDRPYALSGPRGLWRCRSCNKQFTVRIGTIFQRSHIPLRKWLFALWMVATQRYGVSSFQVGDVIGITQKSAWELLDRVRSSLTVTDEVRCG